MVVDTANRLVFNVKPLPNGGISVTSGKESISSKRNCKNVLSLL